MAIRILQNVQLADVPAVKQMFLDQGATNVTETPEGDGEFTVTGFFPDVERHAELLARINAASPEGTV